MQESRHSFQKNHTSRFALILACAGTVAACDGHYPLGSVALDEQALAGGEPSAPAGDGRLGAVLPAADVSINSVVVRPDTLVAAGDMDGDGFGDMAITSTDSLTGLAHVHVRYGGPRPLDADAAFAFERSGAFLTLPGDHFLSLSAAGDVDADGYADLLVRTQDCAVTQPGEGAYLVYGGERLTGSLSLLGVAAHFAPPLREGDDPNGPSCLGSGTPRVAGPGDMDGDGIDDLVFVRAPLSPDDGSERSDGGDEGVYVFYGRAERFSGETPFTAADAWFHIADTVDAFAVGDVNGDGLAELLVTPVEYDWPPSKPGSFLLGGRAERHSGALDLAASTRLIAEAVPGMDGPGDLDGDGIDDLVLEDAERIQHLFYGHPAALEAGFDFAQADAVFPQSELGQARLIGDRDGDGDAELLHVFGVPNPASNPRVPRIVDLLRVDVALLSGSRERLSGEVLFPESEVIAQTPNGRFPGLPHRVLTQAIPAGDLDGDGAGDLFTSSQQVEALPDDGYQIGGDQLHIHYGIPATFTRDPR